MIHEHENTQLDIDDEIIRSYDKMFPGNFCVSANPEFLEGIFKKIECTNENCKIYNNCFSFLFSIMSITLSIQFLINVVKKMDFECAKMFPCLPSRQCAGNDQNRMLLKPFEKSPNSDVNMLSPTQYEQTSNDGFSSTFPLTKQQNNDDTIFSNKHKNYHVPQTSNYIFSYHRIKIDCIDNNYY